MVPSSYFKIKPSKGIYKKKVSFFPGFVRNCICSANVDILLRNSIIPQRNLGALRDLVPFVQSKKREKHPWRSVTFSKVVTNITQLFLKSQ